MANKHNIAVSFGCQLQELVTSDNGLITGIFTQLQQEHGKRRKNMADKNDIGVIGCQLQVTPTTIDDIRHYRHARELGREPGSHVRMETRTNEYKVE